MSKNLFILANSPGELNGWVKPVILSLADKLEGTNVFFVSLPCPYASGMEAECAKSFPLIERCMTVKEAVRGARAMRKNKNMVFQFGGDPFFGFVLSRRLCAHWATYTARPSFAGQVDRYFLPDKAFVNRFEKKHVSPLRYQVAGNLMVDSVTTELSEKEIKEKLGIAPEKKIISMLPGSRPFEYMNVVPFFIPMAEELMERFPGRVFVMPIAPTVEDEVLCDVLKEYGYSFTEEYPRHIKCRGGEILMVRENTFDVIAASELAAALPGTNNLQIASLGVPLVMFAPMNMAELIPLDGIPGLLPTSNYVGRSLKRRLVMWYNRRERFVSLPNRLAGHEIVPEHRYIMTPYMAADAMGEVLGSEKRMREIKEGYKVLDLKKGAAELIADYVREFFA